MRLTSCSRLSDSMISSVGFRLKRVISGRLMSTCLSARAALGQLCAVIHPHRTLPVSKHLDMRLLTAQTLLEPDLLLGIIHTLKRCRVVTFTVYTYCL